MNKLLDAYFGLIKKFIPEKIEGTAVGIDIGTSDCKLIEIERLEGTYKVKRCAVELVKNGNIKEALEKLVGQTEASALAPYTAVSGKGTLIRHIEMPRMAIDDLKTSFSIEADKYFPFAQDQIYTDCFILDPNSKEKQMRVMAVAAKREIIDERVKLLGELGVQVDFIGINAIALSNVYNTLGLDLQEGKKDTAVAVLDMGDSVSNLTISMANLPQFNRDIYIGGRDITKRISNTLGVSIQDAEKLKRAPGEKLAEILSASEAAVENIIQELKLSFDYYTTENDTTISHFYLTGGGSMLNGIVDVFEKNLEVKVSIWNPFETLIMPDDKKLSESQEKKGSASYLKFGVALGLALYRYD